MEICDSGQTEFNIPVQLILRQTINIQPGYSVVTSINYNYFDFLEIKTADSFHFGVKNCFDTYSNSKRLQLTFESMHIFSFFSKISLIQ